MSGLSINSLNNYYSSLYSQGNSSTSSPFQSLGQALQSGKLTAAQSAFAALQASQNQGNTQSPGANNPAATDLNSLATALNSGNLSAAQAAYTQLQKAMQVEGGSGHHHHHGGGGAGDAAQSLIAQLMSSSTGTSTTNTSSGLLDVQA